MESAEAHRAVIVDYLRRMVSDEPWSVGVPGRGFSAGRCLFARSSVGIVVVRLGIDPAIMGLLGNAGITPGFLGGGVSAGVPFSLQEFVEGRHPDEAWYLHHDGAVAALIKRLQQLSPLGQRLGDRDEDFSHRLLRYLAEVEGEYARAPRDHAATDVMAELIQRYHDRLGMIEGGGLVPCHGDINSGNILVAERQSYLIDWETLHLSDPLRDAAHLVWWMYPQQEWARVLAHFNASLADDGQRERFFLHVSMRALYVYLLFLNSGQALLASRFLDDARRAAAYQPPATLLIA